MFPLAEVDYVVDHHAPETRGFAYSHPNETYYCDGEVINPGHCIADDVSHGVKVGGLDSKKEDVRELPPLSLLLPCPWI